MSDVSRRDLQRVAFPSVHAELSLALAAGRHVTGGLGRGSGAGGRCTEQHNTTQHIRALRKEQVYPRGSYSGVTLI